MPPPLVGRASEGICRASFRGTRTEMGGAHGKHGRDIGGAYAMVLERALSRGACTSSKLADTEILDVSLSSPSPAQRSSSSSESSAMVHCLLPTCARSAHRCKHLVRCTLRIVICIWQPQWGGGTICGMDGALKRLNAAKSPRWNRRERHRRACSHTNQKMSFRSPSSSLWNLRQNTWAK